MKLARVHACVGGGAMGPWVSVEQDVCAGTKCDRLLPGVFRLFLVGFHSVGVGWGSLTHLVTVAELRAVSTKVSGSLRGRLKTRGRVDEWSQVSWVQGQHRGPCATVCWCHGWLVLASQAGARLRILGCC